MEIVFFSCIILGFFLFDIDIFFLYFIVEGIRLETVGICRGVIEF